MVQMGRLAWMRETTRFGPLSLCLDLAYRLEFLPYLLSFTAARHTLGRHHDDTISGHRHGLSAFAPMGVGNRVLAASRPRP